MVRDPSLGRVPLLVRVREEVNDEEDAAGAQAGRELAGGVVWVREVMEAEAHGCEVEGVEVGRGEGFGGGCGRVEEVAGVGVHFVRGEALGVC